MPLRDSARQRDEEVATRCRRVQYGRQAEVDVAERQAVRATARDPYARRWQSVAAREFFDVLCDRRRLIFLQEVLGGHGMHLLDGGCAPSCFTLDGEPERRVVGAPDDLHRVGGVAEHARVQVAASRASARSRA